MSQFFTLSFELNATEEKTNKIINTVKGYLVGEGAKEVLFTHSGEADQESDEEEREASAKSRRR